MELRWIERDGKKVLQGRTFICGDASSVFRWMNTRGFAWVDIPFEPEKPKTERERVCDEILKKMKTLTTLQNVSLAMDSLFCFVKEIRNRE